MIEQLLKWLRSSSFAWRMADVDSLAEALGFDRAYRDAPGSFSSIEGEPHFEGPLGADGFPGDQDAVRLALWKKPWGRMMLKSQHEGREMPLTVSVSLGGPGERSWADGRDRKAPGRGGD